jgi:hypothetical protein
MEASAGFYCANFFFPLEGFWQRLLFQLFVVHVFGNLPATV